MSMFASNTCWPARSATSSVNRALSSTGQIVGMPAASHEALSSSPKPGARCTVPVPSSVATQSAPSTTNAPGVSAK